MKIDFGGALVVGAYLAGVASLAAMASVAFAQEPLQLPCPNDEPCKVLILTSTEINVLTGDNGILATAAQARNLDLGQFVAYFRQKIALAPAGKQQTKPAEVKPEVAPKPPEVSKK